MMLLADREYLGEHWLKYLKMNGLDFVIRVKKQVYKKYVDEQRIGENKFFHHQNCRYIGLKIGATKGRYKNVGVAKQIEILEEKYTFLVFKNPKETAKEKLIYFISTLKKKKIVESYPIRWRIECCFKHLKSNGFNLEDLNFKQKQKIKMMMAIVTFYMCFAFTMAC